MLIKHPCSIRAWVPTSFFLSFSLSLALSLLLPPSGSLFHFLIIDSGPPGSSPLKDPNKWRPEQGPGICGISGGMTQGQLRSISTKTWVKRLKAPSFPIPPFFIFHNWG